MSLEVEIKKPVFGKKPGEAFKRLASGMSYAETAAELHRDIETIKSHSKVVRETLHAKSIVEAVAIAVAKGIITITEKGGTALVIAAMVFGSSNPDLEALIKSKAETKIRIERRNNEV